MKIIACVKMGGTAVTLPSSSRGHQFFVTLGDMLCIRATSEIQLPEIPRRGTLPAVRIRLFRGASFKQRFCSKQLLRRSECCTSSLLKAAMLQARVSLPPYCLDVLLVVAAVAGAAGGASVVVW